MPTIISEATSREITLDEREVNLSDIIRHVQEELPRTSFDEVYLPWPASKNPHEIKLAPAAQSHRVTEDVKIYPRVTLDRIISAARSGFPELGFDKIRIGWEEHGSYICLYYRP